MVKLRFHYVKNKMNIYREVDGTYHGEDWTNIKLEFEETSLLEGNRKVSRI